LIRNARNSEIKVTEKGLTCDDTTKNEIKEIMETASSLTEIADRMRKHVRDRWPSAKERSCLVNVGNKQYFGYSNITIKDTKNLEAFCFLELGDIIIKIEVIQ